MSSSPQPLGIFVESGSSAEVHSDAALLEWRKAQADRVAGLADVADLCLRSTIPVVSPNGEHRDFGMAGVEGSDMDDLTISGWGVLFGKSVSAEIRKELNPLLEFRRRQVGSDALFKIIEHDPAWKTPHDWLAPMQIDADSLVEPSSGVPFYILIVASPEEISFEFQYTLDVYWGVGRLWLGSPEEFGAYAKKVIAAEEAPTADVRRELKIFAPRFQNDEATELTTSALVKPLTERLKNWKGFEIKVITEGDATKQNLLELYRGGPGRPAIVFPVTHGLYTLADGKQPERMGALMAEPWVAKEPPRTRSYVTGAEVMQQAGDLTGTIHVLCACFALGWPATSNFHEDETLAPGPMLARLPQVLLAQGALAVLGHIDLAWSYSYRGGDGVDRTAAYKDVLGLLMGGARIGHATDRLNLRWNVLSSRIADPLRAKELTPELSHNLFVERDDARNYIVHGDPAVRLNLPPRPAAGQ